MAHISTTQAQPISILAYAAAIKTNLLSMFAHRQTYLTTLRELNALSDRDLADLGIHRSMVRDIAYEAAYGAKK